MRTWAEVVSDPRFQDLPPERRERAREVWFNESVVPNLPKDKLERARTLFDEFRPEDKAPQTSAGEAPLTGERLGRQIVEGATQASPKESVAPNENVDDWAERAQEQQAGVMTGFAAGRIAGPVGTARMALEAPAHTIASIADVFNPRTQAAKGLEVAKALVNSEGGVLSKIKAAWDASGKVEGPAARLARITGADKIRGPDEAIETLAETQRALTETAAAGRPQNPVGGFLYDAGGAIADLGIAALATKGAGSGAGLGVIGSQVLGSTYGEGKELGLTTEAAADRALANGLAEIVTEAPVLKMLTAPIEVLGGTGAIKKIAEAVGKSFWRRLGVRAAGEGMQEATTAILQDAYDNIELNAGKPVIDILKDALYDGALGAVAGGVVGAPQAYAEGRQKSGQPLGAPPAGPQPPPAAPGAAQVPPSAPTPAGPPPAPPGAVPADDEVSVADIFGDEAPQEAPASQPPAGPEVAPPAAQPGPAQAFLKKAGIRPEVSDLIQRAAGVREFTSGTPVSAASLIESIDDVADADMQAASPQYRQMRATGMSESETKGIMKGRLFKQAGIAVDATGKPKEKAAEAPKLAQVAPPVQPEQQSVVQPTEVTAAPETTTGSGTGKESLQVQEPAAVKDSLTPQTAVEQAEAEAVPAEAPTQPKPRRPKPPAEPTKTAEEFGDRRRKEFVRLLRRAGGLQASESRDITGEPVVRAQQLAPGLFKKAGGRGLDQIATLLHEAGFITDEEYDSVDGGVERARELIRTALEKGNVLSQNDIDEYNRLKLEERIEDDGSRIDADQIADLEEEGLDPLNERDVLDHDLLRRIGVEDEAALERASIQFEDDDVALMEWAQEWERGRSEQGKKAGSRGDEDGGKAAGKQAEETGAEAVRRPGRKPEAAAKETPLSDIKVKRTAIVEETGDQIPIEQDADEAIADIDKQITELRALLRCLRT